MDAKCILIFFFFNDTATTEIYTLSLHDALPILHMSIRIICGASVQKHCPVYHIISYLRHCHRCYRHRPLLILKSQAKRSEEHTSELQSRQYLVCRLLLEKKKKISL